MLCLGLCVPGLSPFHKATRIPSRGSSPKPLSMPGHFQRAHLFTPFLGHSASYHCWHVACAVATILTPAAVYSLWLVAILLPLGSRDDEGEN